MIKVQNLTKAFGPKLAVNNISFGVERGEVLGFLGPNGAGKSTSIRMITGFIPPTSGTVSIGGCDIVENAIAAKRYMGYLPENAPAYTDMTVEGFLGFAAELRGLRGDARKRAIHRALEMCFLESVRHQSIDTLSKGFRHRTCFAQSIIHDPDVLILDEPTDGLDPNQKHEVRTLIKRMGERKAIVFSTHILEEVESACTRAIIIDRGQIVANGTPAELKQRSDVAGAVHLRVVGVPVVNVTQRLSLLPTVRKSTVLRDEPSLASAIRIYPQPNCKNGELARSVSEVVLKEGWKIEELHTEEGRLDEVFRSITLSDTIQEERK